MEKVKIVYEDGDQVRAVTGFLLNEDQNFISIQLENTKLRIHLNHIFKIEHLTGGKNVR